MCSRNFLLVAVIALAGCEPSEDAVARSIEASRLPGEVVLGLLADGSRMMASEQPVPPFSDAPRTMVVRWIEGRNKGSSPWVLDDTPVMDARMIPGTKAAVVITAQRDLVLYSGRHGKATLLDKQVHAPMTMSLDGGLLAYARGEMPDLEIVRYDLRHQKEVSVTHNLAPCWSPVLSEDGSRLLFVSGSSGLPELWEQRESGDAKRITDRQLGPIPFPSGPSVPIFSDGVIAFEDPDGVHVVSVDPVKLLRSIPGAAPVAIGRNRSVLVQDREQRSVQWHSFEQSEVVR